MATNSVPQRQDGSNGLPPAANHGKFGNTPPRSSADDAVSERLVSGVVPKPQRTVINTRLMAGDCLVGEDDSRHRITAITRTTKPGSLILTFASGINGIVSAAGSSVVAADELDEVAELRDESNLFGVSWSQDDCDYAIESFFEDNDELDDDIDQQEVWERLQSSPEWNHLPQAAQSAASWLVESKVGEILREMLAEKATADGEMAFERQIERDGR